MALNCSENAMAVLEEGIIVSAGILGSLYDTVAVPSASIAVVMEMLDGVNVSEIFNTVVTAESPDGTSDDAIVPFNCDDALRVCWRMELKAVLIRALRVCWGMELETVLIRALVVCWGMELETVLIGVLRVFWGMELGTIEGVFTALLPATVRVPWIDAVLVFMGADLTGNVVGLILTSLLLDVITWTALPVLVCCTGLF